MYPDAWQEAKQRAALRAWRGPAQEDGDTRSGWLRILLDAGAGLAGGYCEAHDRIFFAGELRLPCAAGCCR